MVGAAACARPSPVSQAVATPADFWFWLRFRSVPLLTYESTLRCGARESLAKTQNLAGEPLKGPGMASLEIHAAAYFTKYLVPRFWPTVFNDFMPIKLLIGSANSFVLIPRAAPICSAPCCGFFLM